jgi:hypothetical protein
MRGFGFNYILKEIYMSGKIVVGREKKVENVGRLLMPRDRKELQGWVKMHLGLKLPGRGVCAGHGTPLDYLEHVFFELGGTGDTVVWACRGGGKTMIGAVATLLDMVFKPGVQVRILGGSGEQSEKMYTYLCGMAEEKFGNLLAGKTTRKGFAFKNGSKVEILTQSETAVRGTRVQKMRCDEVELFDPGIWSAAQLTTRSLLLEGHGGKGKKGKLLVRGAVEVFSTMHRPGGLMAELVERAKCPLGELRGGLKERKGERKVFAWCVWDVMERCVGRECKECKLARWCQGRGKGAEGFVPVEDVMGLYERSTSAAWEAEMLCQMPYPEQQVFRGFRRERHGREFPRGVRVGESVRVDGRALVLERVVGGIDYGWRVFACVWVALLRDEQGRRVAWVVDEYEERERDLGGHVEAILARDVPGVEARGVVYFADVAGRQHDAHTGRTSEGVLRAAGMVVKSRKMGVESGVDILNELIEPPEVRGKEMWTEGARLLVDPRCVRVMAALAHLERKGETVVKDGKNDHLADAVRYAVAGAEARGGRVEVGRY